MKEIGNKLRLIGNNVEDLKIISAYCQDAIIKITNLQPLKISTETLRGLIRRNFFFGFPDI